MFRFSTLFAICMTVVCVAPALAQNLDRRLPVDSAVTTGTLDNGLRYYIRENARPEQRAELRLVVNAGSVLEDESQLGLAHFAEHMAFNGTANYPKQDLVEYLERTGMRFGPDINAYTSFDETVYMLTVPTDTTEIFTAAFQILEDWAHQVAFDDEEIDLERGVVIEEWRLGRGAAARMLDEQFPVLFRNSRYAERLPIGKPEVLEQFEYETLRRFYRDWYRPDLMAVIAVGDFKAPQVEALIRRHFSSLASPQSPRERTLFDVPGHTETLFAIATDPEAPGSSVSIYHKQPLRDEGTLGAYRQSIVERLYNSMLNTRFFEITQRPDAPFLGAQSGQGRFVRSGEVYFLGAAVADGGIVAGLDAVLTESQRVAQFGFTDSELQRTKINVLRGMEAAHAERDKTMSRSYASEYIRAFLEGESIPGIDFEYQAYQTLMPGIGLDEINRLATEWLVDRNRVVLVGAPEKDDLSAPTVAELSEVLNAVAAKDIVAYEDDVSDAPLLAEVPSPGAVVSEERIDEVDVTIWELANGVRVLLRPTDFQDDQIVFRATSPGGHSLVEDGDFFAALTATAVVGGGGLGEFSSIDLPKVLAGKDARVSPTISELSEGMQGAASPKDIETLFQLIYLRFTSPRRDDDAFLAFKQQVEASIANRGADPRAAFADTLSVTMAQSHHRVRPITVELLQEMDLTTSMEVYRDRFADASDFTFAFVGNFDADSLRPLVETYLGSLPATGRVETWRDVGIEPPRGVVRKVVRRGVEPQSQTRIIFTGDIEYSRETNHLLASMGQLLQTWLRETLREALGGTYSVNVSAGASERPQPRYRITVSFGSAPERADELTQAVFHHIDSLKTIGPTDDDVLKVQESQRRSRETNLRENGYWLGQIISRDRDGADLREILNHEALIDALNAARLRDAAVRHFDLENYVHVVLLPQDGPIN